MADRWTGVCTGGPLDGIQVTVRSSGGFLAVDRTAGHAWVYTRNGQQFTVCTDHDDTLIYPQGATTGVRSLDAERVWQAGANSELDIIALGGG